MGYLLDTNVVINYLESTLPLPALQQLNNIVDNEPILSVITKIEALGFNFISIEEQTAMDLFINGSTVIELTDDIVNKTIQLRKEIKIKLPDAIIASTALVYDLTLISRNVADFKNINNLKVIDPYSF